MKRTDWAPEKSWTLDDRLGLMLDSPDYGEQFAQLMREAGTVVALCKGLPGLSNPVRWRSRYTQWPKSTLAEAAAALCRLRQFIEQVMRECPEAKRRIWPEESGGDGKVGSMDAASHKN